MTATLRVVLDQVVAPTDADLETASRELARALIATAPAGCDVAAIIPSVQDAAGELESAVPGLADVTRASLARRELAASWQLGIAPGVGGGMIHSPTSLAPLIKHDRAHDNDQTVVTMWDLAAWERSGEMPLFRIEKNPKLAAKQGAFSVVSTSGMILKRGHDLSQVLKVFDKQLKLVEK